MQFKWKAAVRPNGCPAQALIGVLVRLHEHCRDLEQHAEALILGDAHAICQSQSMSMGDWQPRAESYQIHPP